MGSALAVPGRERANLDRLLRASRSCLSLTTSPATPLEVIDSPASLNQFRAPFEDICIVCGACEFVIPFDQKPVLVFLAGFAAHPHEMPAAFKLLAIKLEVEMALLQAAVWIADRRPRALVPYDDRAAAVFALGDRAFEIGVFQRMVLDRDRKALLAGKRLGPRVTAQLFSTPSRASRKSSCSRVASCFCTTKTRLSASGAAPLGSAVAAKLRFLR